MYVPKLNDDEECKMNQFEAPVLGSFISADSEINALNLKQRKLWGVSAYLVCVKDLRAPGGVFLLVPLLFSPQLLFLRGLPLLDSMFIQWLISIGGLVFVIL